MPHFYFDFIEDDHLKPDPEGQDFSDVRAARDAAAHTLTEIVRDDYRHDGRGNYGVVVRDAGGAYKVELRILIAETWFD